MAKWLSIISTGYIRKIAKIELFTRLSKVRYNEKVSGCLLNLSSQHLQSEFGAVVKVKEAEVYDVFMSIPKNCISRECRKV